MSLLDRKIPVLEGVNDIPSVEGDAKHPNASLVCKQLNDLIDNELTDLQNSIGTGGLSKIPVYQLITQIPFYYTIYYSKDLELGDFSELTYTADIFENIRYRLTNVAESASLTLTVTEYRIDGDTYNPSVTNTVPNFGDILIGTGGATEITLLSETVFNRILVDFAISDVGNAQLIVDIIVLPDHNTLVGGIGGNVSGIESITSTDNGNGTKTITFWGDLAETINLGSVVLDAGVDGADGADGISPTVTVLTQAAYDALGTYDSNTFYVING